MCNFIKNRIRSFSYAINGLCYVLKNETNLKIHLIATLVVVAAGFYFQINTNEWCLTALTIGLVISLEIVNSAIEKLVDLVSPEKHPKAGLIKDIAAASVLFAAIIAICVACFIFLPKL